MRPGHGGRISSGVMPLGMATECPSGNDEQPHSTMIQRADQLEQAVAVVLLSIGREGHSCENSEIRGAARNLTVHLIERCT